MSEAQSKTHEGHHRVWPIFVLALLLAAFGFWFAFRALARPVEAPAALPAPFIADALPPLEPAPLTQPVALAYAPADRRYALDLRQERERDGHTARTWIVSTVHDQPAQTEQLPAGAAWSVVRRYEGTRIRMQSENEEVADAITQEVAGLVDTAAHQLAVAPTGEVVAYQLLSTEVLQLRATLALLREATEVLSPRVPREAVNSGEEWRWEVPVAILSATDEHVGPTTVHGSTELAAKVVGIDADSRPLVELRIDARHEGTTVDEADRPVSFEYTTRGTGSVVWSTDAGQPTFSELLLDQRAKVGDAAVTSRFQLRLEALPDQKPPE